MLIHAIVGIQQAFRGMYVVSCVYQDTIGLQMHAEIVYRLIANITRLFFWLGNHFEFALLMQSVLMILAQACHFYRYLIHQAVLI